MPIERLGVEAPRLVKRKNIERHTYDADRLLLDKFHDSFRPAHSLPCELKEGVRRWLVPYLTESADIQTMDTVCLVNNQQSNRKTHVWNTIPWLANTRA